MRVTFEPIRGLSCPRCTELMQTRAPVAAEVEAAAAKHRILEELRSRRSHVWPQAPNVVFHNDPPLVWPVLDGERLHELICPLTVPNKDSSGHTTIVDDSGAVDACDVASALVAVVLRLAWRRFHACLAPSQTGRAVVHVPRDFELYDLLSLQSKVNGEINRRPTRFAVEAKIEEGELVVRLIFAGENADGEEVDVALDAHGWLLAGRNPRTRAQWERMRATLFDAWASAAVGFQQAGYLSERGAVDVMLGGIADRKPPLPLTIESAPIAVPLATERMEIAAAYLRSRFRLSGAFSDALWLREFAVAVLSDERLTFSRGREIFVRGSVETPATECEAPTAEWLRDRMHGQLTKQLECVRADQRLSRPA